jgi:hypothetical protein
MQLIFAKFDSEKSRWAAAAQATALLDAIGSLAQVAAKPGFTRAKILECPSDRDPGVKILSGRHPCVETTIYGEEFIPNDLALGSGNESDAARVLLLSGPNMVSLTSQKRKSCTSFTIFSPEKSCHVKTGRKKYFAEANVSHRYSGSNGQLCSCRRLRADPNRLYLHSFGCIG